MARIFLAAALCLAGCNESAPVSQDSMFALKNAERRIADLEVRVAELEADLALEKHSRERLTDAAIKDGEGRDAELARLTRNQEGFKKNIDYLRALHGRENMPVE